MRELKFRAWDRVKRKMLYGVSPFNVHITDENEPLLSLERSEHDDCEFMQYTGLKDKNGKEIYEGDIVEYTTCYYGNEKHHRKVVEWEEWDSDDFGEPHNIGYFDLSEYMGVIGNIHENPELLKEEE